MALQLSNRNTTPVDPSTLERHPNSMEADKNAFIVPEQYVISKRKNEQLHLIPMSDSDNKGIIVRMAIYVNGGVWDGKLWKGYLKNDNARMPLLTTEGLRLLACKAAELSKEIDDTLASGS